MRITDSNNYYPLEEKPNSAQDEILKQDRARLMRAGFAGTAIACVMMGGAFFWTTQNTAPYNYTTTYKSTTYKSQPSSTNPTLSTAPLKDMSAKPVKAVINKIENNTLTIETQNTQGSEQSMTSGAELITEGISGEIFSITPKKVKSTVLENKAE